MMQVKEKSASETVILPILDSTDQVVLEAVQAIKSRGGMTFLPSPGAVRREIERLGYELPTLPTVRASLARLVKSEYIVIPKLPTPPEIEVRQYRQEVAAVVLVAMRVWGSR